MSESVSQSVSQSVGQSVSHPLTRSHSPRSLSSNNELQAPQLGTGLTQMKDTISALREDQATMTVWSRGKTRK